MRSSGKALRFSAASVGLVNGGKAYENGQMAGGRLVISAPPRNRGSERLIRGGVDECAKTVLRSGTAV